MSENRSPESLLESWFGEDLDDREAVAARSALWFTSSEPFDEMLRQKFSDLPDRALRGDLESWRGSARSALALVIALDQLPRNLYRDTGRAFAYDPEAVAVSAWARDRNLDSQVHPLQAVFFYLPLEHAEDPELQTQSVALFRDLLERAPRSLAHPFESFLSYAERHHEVIARFGRFPHRNDILGRESTPEEARYLRDAGEHFSRA